jgi:hypothetical protein
VVKSVLEGPGGGGVDRDRDYKTSK